jgi:2'-5' RNA ligase
MLRTFIAIHIPDDMRQAISRALVELRKVIGKSAVRWVAPENIHLTLKFLGDAPVSDLDQLQQMLAVEAARHRRFQVELGGLGVFPDIQHPRIVWIGLEAPRDLSALQHGVEACTERLGYPRESRPFSPHLTVGRIRDHLSPGELNALRMVLEPARVPFLGRADVGRIHLMKSELHPEGSTYRTLFTASLATG